MSLFEPPKSPLPPMGSGARKDAIKLTALWFLIPAVYFAPLVLWIDYGMKDALWLYLAYGAGVWAWLR
jgi:hypothetical protein